MAKDSYEKSPLTKPTSSNKFGKIQIARFAANTVIHQKINLTIASTIIAPINTSAAMERYHTPTRSFTGHKGNMTPASITMTIAAAPRMVHNGEPS